MHRLEVRDFQSLQIKKSSRVDILSHELVFKATISNWSFSFIVNHNRRFLIYSESIAESTLSKNFNDDLRATVIIIATFRNK